MARWSIEESARKLIPVRARAVLLATGGLGRVFSETTNPAVATGDGVAMAWRAGAEISDIEFVQFHPTALHVEGAPRFLLSEALRGEGAFLINAAGERFMQRYHPLADLAPRDVVSRSIVAEMAAHRRAARVSRFDPSRHGIHPGALPAHLSRRACDHGIDLGTQPAPVHPAAHYAMGGVRTDLDGRTSLPGLYAAGEVACTGVHGANRLASNSLLEGVVFGARAGVAMRALGTIPVAQRTATLPPCLFPSMAEEPSAPAGMGGVRNHPPGRCSAGGLRTPGIRRDAPQPGGPAPGFRVAQHARGGAFDRPLRAGPARKPRRALSLGLSGKARGVRQTFGCKRDKMKSSSDKPRQVFAPVCMLLLLAVAPIQSEGPSAILWTAPCILVAAMLIAWAAESAQFFMAQGFALAMLAWLQTLPEFAVEAVLAWHQQSTLLIANLTGALRLLTGLGWPMIYATAAIAYRSRSGKPLRRITLEPAHSIEVIGLLACMAYVAVIWGKGSLDLIDAVVLIAIYVAYLLVLRRMPPESSEGIEDLERIPRSIVQARRPVRIALIAGLFIGGGALIYFTAEPFLGSLLAVSAVAGNSEFCFRAMGGAIRFRISRKGLRVLLGPHRGARVDGADEHGFEQHQPVDAAHSHAADRVFAQQGRDHGHRFRFAAETGTAHDPGPVRRWARFSWSTWNWPGGKRRCCSRSG